MAFRRIVLFAASGAYNLGDEAIVLAEYAFLRKRYPDAEIRVATYDPKSTLLSADDPKLGYFRYFPCAVRRHPLANVGYFFRNVAEIFQSSLVIIGGGGLFYDNESGQSFKKQALEWAFRTALARLFWKTVLFWGVGVDVSSENAPALATIFSGAAVTVRDEKSAETLRGIGITSKVVPDPAFLVPMDAIAEGSSGNHSGSDNFWSRQIGTESPAGSPEVSAWVRTDVNSWRTRVNSQRIGISLRKGYLNGGIESVRAIVRIIRENSFEPVFVNHSFHPDAAETDDSRFVADIAREENVASTASLAESFLAYRGLSGMVAMRLHSGLLAFASGVPCFLLSYSEKTDAFARRTQAPWCIPASDFTVETFKKSFAEFAERLATPAFFALPEKCGKIVSETRISYEQTFYGLESDHGEGQRPEGPSPR